MNYKLPTLNYDYNAMEPVIDALTMQIHYTKHHQAYINNLNNALTNFPNWKDVPIHKLMINFNKLPEEIKIAVKNNGGGHVNHSLFWEIIQAPKDDNDKNIPEDLLNQITINFKGLTNFKTFFEKAAMTRFGSGWAWLVVNQDHQLEIISTPNQDSPLMEHKIPILGLDVWEHAYYLNYQNKRLDYVNNFWKIINWKIVNQKFLELKDSFLKDCSSCCSNH